VSGADAWNTALRLLTRRGFCEAELAARLRSKKYSADEIAAALERCRELGYLDDSRYAGERARSLLRSGRAAGRRVLSDLTARGVPAATAVTALAAAQSEYPPPDALRQLLERRYPDFNYATADDRTRRRVVNFFLRRGFELSLVLAILHDERDVT